MDDRMLNYFIWFSMVLPFLSLCFLFFVINFYFNRKLEKLKWDLIVRFGNEISNEISKLYKNMLPSFDDEGVLIRSNLFKTLDSNHGKRIKK